MYGMQLFLFFRLLVLIEAGIVPFSPISRAEQLTVYIITAFTLTSFARALASASIANEVS